MFNKKDKDPAELPLEGEEGKKKGFILLGARGRKTPPPKS